MNSKPGDQPGAAQPPHDYLRVRRFGKRAGYDRELILSILADGLMCHVGFVHESRPIVIPTLYWHDNEQIYFHGSSASRMIRAAEVQPICVAVTHIDGLVLTQTGFHHSANYRSVMVFGKAEVVREADAKILQLRSMMERMFPGRWDQLRPIRQQELKATQVMSLSLDNASAKCRAGPTVEDEGDLDWPVWAGVFPISQTIHGPLVDTSGAGGDLPAPAFNLLGNK